MKEPRQADERLSALLDGRVDTRGREELLAHLSTADDDYEVFRDTAVILHQLEEDARADTSPRTTPVVPFRIGARASGWRGPARWAALAAVLAALTVTGVRVWRERASAAGDPVRLAALVETAGEGLPEGWTERSRWASARGGGAPGGLTPHEHAAEAARAGALLVDLAVAVRARHTADTRLLATQLRSRYEAGAGRGGALWQIGERAGAPPDSLRPLLERATDRLEDRLEKEPLRLGAWTEAARLAARRRDEAFFRTGATRTMLGRAERLTAEDPAAASAVTRVRASVAAKRTPEWDGLERDLDTLLREIAS